MEYKEIENFKIPIIGLGTWQIGGRTEADYSCDSKNIEAIKNAINMGYNLIDTAEMYGNGHTEELVGKAIVGYDRKKLFIVSKVYNNHLAYDDLLCSAEQSLRRLGIKYFDLYLIHLPNPEVSIKETMKAMDFLVEKGLTRFIGVSNFSVEQIKQAQKYSKNKIVANQLQYSLLTRNEGTYGNYKGMESDIIPYCQKNNIIIMADRPLDKGELIENNNPILEELCNKYNKTKAQIALNWLISKKNIITIPKATSKKHLEENLGTLGWNLSEKDMRMLNETNFRNI